MCFRHRLLGVQVFAPYRGIFKPPLEVVVMTLLAQDYFHAVHEAAKSLCDRVRMMSGLPLDGTELFQTAFSVSNPYIAFNSLRTSSERNQQNGLKEMLCGVIHMIRNVTAHELRIHWNVNEKDAIDILTQISYLHKLLDACTTVKTAI